MALQKSRIPESHLRERQFKSGWWVVKDPEHTKAARPTVTLAEVYEMVSGEGPQKPITRGYRAWIKNWRETGSRCPEPVAMFLQSAYFSAEDAPLVAAAITLQRIREKQGDAGLVSLLRLLSKELGLW